MGHIEHHAIIVTTFSEAYIQAAYDKAAFIFGANNVPAPVESGTNGYWSLFIPPDGSKEGWEASDQGDECRARFLAWLAAQAYEDGSSPYDSLEVVYGGDTAYPYITAIDGLPIATPVAS